MIPEISPPVYGLIKVVKSLSCKQCKVAYNEIDKPIKNKMSVKRQGKSTIFFPSLSVKC